MYIHAILLLELWAYVGAMEYRGLIKQQNEETDLVNPAVHTLRVKSEWSSVSEALSKFMLLDLEKIISHR